MNEDKPTPSSLRIEKSVLSCLIQYTDLQEEETITAELFFHHANKILFHEINQLGRPVDLIVLTQKLIDNKKIETIGGPSAIQEIYTFQPTSQHFKEHVAKLHDYAARRAAIKASNELIGAAYDTSDLDAYIDLSRAPMDKIGEIADASSPTRSRADIIKTMKDGFLERLANKDEIKGWQTGIWEIDHKFNGLHPKQMSVIGGFPTSGKSVLAVQALFNIAKEGTPTLIISLEMTEDKLADNTLIMASGLTHKAVTRPHEYAQEQGLRAPSKGHLLAIKKGMDIVDKTPFYYEAPTGRGRYLSSIELTIRRYVKKFGVKVVAVDFLQKMKESGQQSREQQLSTVIDELQSLEQELDIHLMLLSQLNKEGNHKHAESINEGADMALNIIQDMDKESDDYRKHLGLSVKKDKWGGATGQWLNVILNKDFLRFEAAPQQHSPQH